MSTHRQHTSIRGLFWLAVALIVGAVAASALTVWGLRSDAIEEAANETENLAIILAEQTTRSVQSIELVMLDLEEHLTVSAPADRQGFDHLLGSERTHALLKERQGRLSQATVIGLFDRDGQARNTSREWPPRSVNIADREFFQYLKSHDKHAFQLFGPVSSRATGAPTIYFAQRLSTGDEFAGIIVVGVELAHFRAIYESVTFLRNQSFLFLRSDGTVLVRHPDEVERAGSKMPESSPWHRLVAQGGGFYRSPGYFDGIARLVAVRPVREYPLVVNVAIPEDAALATWRRRATLIGIGTLLALCGSIILLTQLSGHFRRLLESEQSLAERSAMLAEKSSQLEEANVRLDAALNNMSQGLCMFAADETLVLCNQRYLEMYALSAEVIRPGCNLRDLLEARVVAGTFHGNIDEYILAHRQQKHVTSKSFDLPDGRTIAIVDRLMDNGGWVSTHEDVTQRRQAEMKLAQARAEAQRAEQEARAAHARLRDAFEVMPEGLVLFDSDDRFVLWNRRYAELYGGDDEIRLGARFEDVVRAGLARGVIPEAKGLEEEWLRERLARHADVENAHEQQLAGNRWVRVEERRTADGGSIGVRTDITELKERESSFRLLFEGNPLPMFLYEPLTFAFIDVNQAAIQHFGYTREQFLAMKVFDIWPAAERDRYAAMVAGWGDFRVQNSWRYRKADGTGFEAAVYSKALSFRSRPARFVAVVDITERRRAEAERDRSRELLNSIIENIPITIFVKDVEQRYVLINRAGEELWGLRREQMLGKTVDEVFLPDSGIVVTDGDWTTWRSDDPVVIGEHVIHTPENGARLVTSKRLRLCGPDGTPAYLLGLVEDITERKRSEAQIVYMARHDLLTALPNRAYFMDRMEEAAARMRRRGEPFAVFILDLDRFKIVNDSLGHPAGDALLKETAVRLKSALRETDVLARLGGDEFAIIQPGEAEPHEGAASLAERIVDLIRAPFLLEGNQVSIGTSIGIAIAPGHGSAPAELIKNADLALYRAKSQGRNGYQFFDAQMMQEVDARHRLENDLRQALAHDELTVFYQPVVELKSGKVCGVEALARWRHPQKGWIPPDQFIPLAEETGLIGSLGEWVLQRACGDAASWPAHVKVAVNLSAFQFRRHNLFEVILCALTETGLPPERLELEITESVLIESDSDPLPTIRQLKNIGISLALDDFGTGYSSLSYLTKFPFDKIKIDKSFIQQLTKRAGCAAIVASVCALGAGLDVQVVAEGIETEQQLGILRATGVALGQGYLFGRPCPASELDLTATHTGRRVGHAA